MKILSFIFIILISLLNNCSKNPASDNTTKPEGEGIRFYFADNNSNKAYPLTIEVDSASMEPEPFIYYENLISFDTSTFEIKVNVNTDSIYDYSYSALYHLFVITLDSIPKFTGWMITGGNSIMPRGVYIETIDFIVSDSSFYLRNSNPDSTQIDFIDIRRDSAIVERLSRNGKII